jgi:hypothetical protein
MAIDEPTGLSNHQAITIFHQIILMILGKVPNFKYLTRSHLKEGK